jgi:hypothetical protein
METKNASVEISIPRTDQLTVAGIDNAGVQREGRHRTLIGYRWEIGW